MSSHENKPFRYKDNDEEGTNGSEQVPIDRNKNGKDRNGKTKDQYQNVQQNSKRNGPNKDHYQHPPEGMIQGVLKKKFHMTDMIRVVDSARQSLAEVDDMYDQLVSDIEEAVHNREQVAVLEGECRQQVEDIKDLQKSFDRLVESSGRNDKNLELKKEANEAAEKVLEKKKADIEKLRAREEMKAKEAELERTKLLDAQSKKQRASLDKEFKVLQEKLEKDLKKQEDDNKKLVKDLEAEKKRLSSQVKELNAKVERHVKSLAIGKERLEDMENLKRLSKEEATRTRNELRKLKDEFGLSSNTFEFFQKKFEEIAHQIHAVSTDFCLELNPGDWTSVHQKLKGLDPCFASIPISGSNESKALRIAHVERIISFSLSTLVFKPFSSDNTFHSDRKDAVSLLEEAALGLGCSGDNKQAVLKSLVVRGLRLSRESQAGSPLPSTRIDAFVQSVKPILSLLVPGSQYARLELTLRAMAKSAILFWDEAQSDEALDIKASLDLDPILQKAWSSRNFLSELDTAGNPVDLTTQNQHRVFTLFPHITARSYVGAIESAVNIPGSFEVPKVESKMQELSIHPGIGMCETSALVSAGKEEQEEIEQKIEEERIEKEYEAGRKALDARSKIKSQRNGSIGSTTGPSSPTAGWNSLGGTKKSSKE